MVRSEDSRSCRGTERGGSGVGVAGGAFPFGLPPFLGTNLSPIKRVTFWPHELMLGALWGPWLGQGAVCSSPAEEGSPRQDCEPLGLQPSPVHCGIKRKAQHSKDRAALWEVPEPAPALGPQPACVDKGGR